MRASELIDDLKRLVEFHGDRDVIVTSMVELHPESFEKEHYELRAKTIEIKPDASDYVLLASEEY